MLNTFHQVNDGFRQLMKDSARWSTVRAYLVEAGAERSLVNADKVSINDIGEYITKIRPLPNPRIIDDADSVTFTHDVVYFERENYVRGRFVVYVLDNDNVIGYVDLTGHYDLRSYEGEFSFTPHKNGLFTHLKCATKPQEKTDKKAVKEIRRGVDMMRKALEQLNKSLEKL